MKVSLQDSRRYILRFDKGEEIFGALTDFCVKNEIKAASFMGLGTSGEVELGYFNAFLKEYRKKPHIENLEIVSLIGNIAWLENKPVVHAHGSFGRTDFSLIGGHVFKLVVLATCEIFLIKLEGQLDRENNPEFNLNFLK